MKLFAVLVCVAAVASVAFGEDCLHVEQRCVKVLDSLGLGGKTSLCCDADGNIATGADLVVQGYDVTRFESTKRKIFNLQDFSQGCRRTEGKFLPSIIHSYTKNDAACKNETNFEVFQTQKQLVDKISSELKGWSTGLAAKGAAGLATVAAKWAMSTSSKESKMVYFRSTSVCERFGIQLATDPKVVRAALAKDFLDDINNLPLKMDQKYERFVEEWGTHHLTAVGLGSITQTLGTTGACEFSQKGAACFRSALEGKKSACSVKNLKTMKSKEAAAKDVNTNPKLMVPTGVRAIHLLVAATGLKDAAAKAALLKSSIEQHIQRSIPSGKCTSVKCVTSNCCYPAAMKTNYVTVTVIKATHLKDMDSLGTTDAYVNIYVPGQSTRRTRTIDGSENPRWNQSFTYYGVTLGGNVKFHMFDQDGGLNGRNDNMGSCTGRVVFGYGSCKIPTGGTLYYRISGTCAAGLSGSACTNLIKPTAMEEACGF